MRIVFIGTGEIGLPTLRALQKSDHELVGVVTQPDKPVGRDQKIEPTQVKKEMAGSNISVLQPARIKDPQAIEQIRAMRPEIIVVMAYGQILPRDVLEIPTSACLNLHASLLPCWRGAAPIQAAIAAGDPKTGITVIYMDEGLDTGDILLKRELEILPTDTGQAVHDRLAKIAAEACLDSLQLLAKGTASRIPQDKELATYAPKLTREDGQIEWNESAQSIERKIRAYDPWPGAFTPINGRNLKIFRASIVEIHGKPGEILRADRELAIAANDGALSLIEVQLEGKRRMNAAEFLRGRNLSSLSRHGGEGSPDS